MESYLIDNNAPDAIIAATALVHGFTLITNDGHFDNIQDLRTIDPQRL